MTNSVKAYYMRDNHTFAPVPLDPDAAEMILRQEFDDGWTYGMLCSKSDAMPSVLHASGNADREQFISSAREWIDEAKRKST